MCGLVGMAGIITQKERKAFRLLLRLDTVRGEHSTGVAAINDKKESFIFKQACNGYDFLGFKKGDQIVDKHLAKVMIGHNRFATKGAVNLANAHPFEHGHIIGAHNGTLRTMHGLSAHADFGTDSEAIFKEMSLRKDKEVIGDLHGAFALTWYNHDENTINLIRNNQRPLAFCFTKDRKTVFWASEVWMLEVSLDSVGLEHTDIIRCKSMRKYRFSIPEAKYNKQLIFEAISHTDIKEYESPLVQTRTPPAWDRRTGRATQGRSSTTSTKTKSTGANGGTKSKKPEAGDNSGSFQPSLIGSSIDVVSCKRDQECAGREFIECRSVDGWDTIRLYIAHNNPKGDWIMDSDKPLRVRINAFSKKGGYMVGDLASIKEIEWEDLDFDDEDYNDDETIVTIDCDGVAVTKEEWTRGGVPDCDWCSSPIFSEEAGISYIRWPELVICPGCKDLPEVNYYVDLDKSDCNTPLGLV